MKKNASFRSTGWLGRAKLVGQLKGPGTWIAKLAWSPNGRELAVAAQKGRVILWNTDTRVERTLNIGSYHVYNAIWSPDGKTFAISTDEGEIFLLDAQTLNILTKIKRAHDVMGLAWSPDGQTLALGTDFGIYLWDLKSGSTDRRFREQKRIITVKFSPDGRRVAATSYSGGVCIWDSLSGKLLGRLKESTHGAALEWSSDGKYIISGMGPLVGVWDTNSGELRHILEGHLDDVRTVAYSQDGKLLATRAGRIHQSQETPDPYILLWRTDSWKLCAKYPQTSSWYLFAGLAFSPKGPFLANTTAEDTVVHIWKLDIPSLLHSAAKSSTTIYYKNAKVALVGDSGVGKSALALVLARHKFAGTESTHARRISMLDSTRTAVRKSKIELRETVLWDLAGQPGYRLIHQLHLADIAAAAIVFDSRNELDPFSAVRHWNRALLQAARFTASGSKTPKRFLVAARIDRGTVGVSRARIESLMNELGIQSYIETSAKEGIGIVQLRNSILKQIDWQSLPAVSSNQLFQRIKRFILGQKKRGVVLTTANALLRSFSQAGSKTVDASEFDVSIGRLQSLGLVRRFSFGDLILLQPQLVDAVSSAIISAARQEPDGMGSMHEDLVRTGQFKLPKEAQIGNPEHQKLLIVATTEELIAHEIALREPSNDGTLLVFPSQLTRENPELPDPIGKEIEVVFEGPVFNIYATLIVRLAHSGVFKLHELWKNAATFLSDTGSISGLFLTEDGEGRATVTLFYDERVTSEMKHSFEDFISAHICRLALPDSVQKRAAAVCLNPNCRTPFSTTVIEKRKARGFDWIECNVCGETVNLAVPKPLTRSGNPTIVEMGKKADRRKDVETALVSASGEMLTSGFRRWAGAAKTTVALVFTDIVGSTVLGNKLGDERMSDLRQKHFAEARKLIRKHNGYEIKTIGDSFMVAFRAVVDALDFCLQLRKETGHSDVAIRAGIHVGPVHIEEEDAFGTMVNYAARVIGHVHGTEICVSERAYRDIESEKATSHKELEWVEERDVALKGFPELHTLWLLRS